MLTVQKWHAEATSMRTKATLVGGTKLLKTKTKIELKSQQPWTAVSAMLGLVSTAQCSVYVGAVKRAAVGKRDVARKLQ